MRVIGALLLILLLAGCKAKNIEQFGELSLAITGDSFFAEGNTSGVKFHGQKGWVMSGKQTNITINTNITEIYRGVIMQTEYDIVEFKLSEQNQTIDYRLPVVYTPTKGQPTLILMKLQNLSAGEIIIILNSTNNTITKNSKVTFNSTFYLTEGKFYFSENATQTIEERAQKSANVSANVTS